MVTKFSEVLGRESDTTENYIYFNAHTKVTATNADVVTSEPHPYVQNIGSTHPPTIQLFTTALENGSCLLIVTVMVVLKSL